MFETPITVVGTIITTPDRRWVGEQQLFKFRVASNSRRRAADGSWEPGNTLYATVNCWGRLVTGAGAALGKGDAVIVVGYLYTNEYEDRDGNRRSSLEIRATSVGPDLARCIASIDRRRHPEPAEDDTAAMAANGSSSDGVDGTVSDEDVDDGSDQVGGELARSA
ncbi:single-stranded DNA-binding protein [Mycobacterium sp. SMC-4]|uniref:single-stranded DNA-binding protein n=1 Tax=Mycobacterium sp. SMC-4 TaxID=2857059 RepID=UPI003D007CD8